MAHGDLTGGATPRCCGLQSSCHCFAALAFVLACCAVAIAILLYGPSSLLRRLLSLLPSDPGLEWCVGLSATTALSIVMLMPIWPPLCMVSGLLFDVYLGTVVNIAAIVGAANISIALGRCFLQEPIRRWLETEDYRQLQRIMMVLEDSDDSLKFQVLFRFLFIPMFVRNYGPSVLKIPFWKLGLSTLPHGAWASFIFASLGASFKDAAELLRSGGELDLRAVRWQQALLLAISLAVALLLALYAHRRYAERLAEDEGAALAPGGGGAPPAAAGGAA